MTPLLPFDRLDFCAVVMVDLLGIADLGKSRQWIPKEKCWMRTEMKLMNHGDQRPWKLVLLQWLNRFAHSPSGKQGYRKLRDSHLFFVL
jgi:hypothetical protein